MFGPKKYLNESIDHQEMKLNIALNTECSRPKVQVVLDPIGVAHKAPMGFGGSDAI